MHETKVEKFYSTGTQRRKCDFVNVKQHDDGFLSFGYWDKGVNRYLNATQRLLTYFITHSGIKRSQRILNVACGYGSETFAYYDKLKPTLIEGIDITRPHVDYANNKAKALSLDNRIRFNHGNACKLDYENNYFSHVLSIEGSAHFKTRTDFFAAAHRVLKKKGEMVLTDIILGKRFKKSKLLNYLILKLTAYKWVIPKENWVGEPGYKKQLNQAGFQVVFFKKIGKKVFPGYAKNGFSFHTIKTRLSQRGFWATIGLTIISAFLGYLFNRGYLDYVYIKARKD